jgi:hypothetical protein
VGRPDQQPYTDAICRGEGAAAASMPLLTLTTWVPAHRRVRQPRHLLNLLPVPRRSDEHVRWRADPENDRGYCERDGRWRSDPGARLGGRSDVRRYRRGERVSCEASDRVRPWRGGWRPRGWRHGRRRRRGLKAGSLVGASGRSQRRLQPAVQGAAPG